MRIDGSRIFITGGTGSFGKAFIETLIKNEFNPTKVTIYSRDWQKQKEMKDKFNVKWLNFKIGDIRDKSRLHETVQEEQYDILIHAAAIKCIEACEKNITECLQTNIMGTQNIIDVIRESCVAQAILISTDKAVLPINTYGTSKKMAEKLWINSNCPETSFVICRYGNVIGSNGSVLPLFLNMIKNGVKKLPITDERMTRFWFEINDAINFVLRTIQLNAEGVQVPMIPSIKMTDLCKALNMEYEVIGIREGEKLHEYMIPPDEITGDIGYSSGNNKHFLTVDEIKTSILNFKKGL